jgi:hypothetical protein
MGAGSVKMKRLDWLLLALEIMVLIGVLMVFAGLMDVAASTTIPQPIPFPSEQVRPTIGRIP